MAFNKGDNQLTSHIIYREWANGNRKVSFWEGKINDDGSVTTLSEYLIENGYRHSDIKEFTNVIGCIVSWCGAAAFTCKFTNCAYFKCLGIACGGIIIGCVLCELLGC